MESNIDVQFCPFRTEMSFLSKFNKKKKNFSWNLVLLICTIPWWCSFFLFSTRYTFLRETLNCLFNVNFGTQTNLNIQNWIVMSTFFAFYSKCWYWANLVLNFKIVCEELNFVHRAVRISRTQWWCSLFSFSTGYNFLLNLVWKIKIFSLSWNLALR